MKKINSDLNILISCHKNFYIPDSKYFIPVQVGSLKAANRFDMLHDDEGDNISELNPYFCELTAQYWAWKNLESEYYGFFHYRRYMMILNSFPQDRELVVYDNINKLTLERCGLDNDEKILEEISKYDIILPNKCKCHPYEHYKTSDQHHIQDLDFIINLIHERCPQFDKYVKEALYGDYTYFWNIYIMKKKYFFEYCEWLFPLLFEFQKRKCYENCSIYEKRTPGLLAERMLTIFMLYIRDTYKDIKIKEVPTALFEEVDNPEVEPKFKERNAIVYSANYDSAKFLSASISSLLDSSNSAKDYDVVIFDNGLSFHQKNLLNKQFASNKNFSLRFIRTLNYANGIGNDEANRVYRPALPRVVLCDLLYKYNKVVYLENHTIVKGDISEIFDIDLHGNYVGAVLDIFDTVNEHHYIWSQAKDINKNPLLDDSRFFKRFDIGVLLYDFNNIKNLVHAKDVYEKLNQCNWSMNEKELLHQVFGGKIEYIPSCWNYRPESDIPVNELMSVKGASEHFEYYIRGKANPKIVNFTDNSPLRNKAVESSDCFWKYARESLFYEELLLDMAKEKANEIFVESRKKPGLKQKIKKLFPKDSRRGKFIRKIFKRK